MSLNWSSARSCTPLYTSNMEDEIPKDVAAESGLDKVYDENHNDPSADVILVSNDNVSFRVSSWYLKQKS